MATTRIDDVPAEWQQWAALSLLDGQQVGEVVAVMAADGVEEVSAAMVCAQIIAGGPAWDAAKITSGQLHKLESFIDVRRQMRALSPQAATVERRSGCTREQFLDEFYAANRPVILEDVCDIWPARGLWSPEYLVEAIGETDVEVMTGRDGDAQYEMNADEHREEMPFAEYVARVLEGGSGNDVYLVANNEFLSGDAAAPLWDDFTIDQRYLSVSEDRSGSFLWFGPAGTVTPLHHDSMNILFNQVVGKKRFRLVSPLDSPWLYNSVSVYSEVDPRAPDLGRYPLYSNARPIELVLEPGETLFVPVGWWHQVESLDVCLSVSFTNFVFDNDPEWYELEAL